MAKARSGPVELPPEITTLEEVRAWLADNMGDPAGAVCPACGRYTKAYTRRITSSMARALLLLYAHWQHANDDGWQHVDKFLMARGVEPGPAMPAMLRHWGLLERQPGKADDGNAPGMYRLTDRGKRFAAGEITVEKYVRLFDDTKLPLDSDERVNIKECLGRKFSYNELMGQPAGSPEITLPVERMTAEPPRRERPAASAPAGQTNLFD